MSDTIFMIHGMWGTADDWDHYRPFFEARGYRCVTPTLPYHDMDPRAAPDPRLGTVSLVDYAAALEREIRQLGDTPIVMGHSMGGLLAQMLGARGLARRLVLLMPAAPAGIFSITPSVIRAFWSTQTTWGFWKKPMRQTFAEASYSMMHLLPEAEQRAAYDKLVYESGRAAFEIGYWPLDLRGAARVDESKITCPMLVIGGAQDRITPPSVVRRIARKYRAVASYKEFPDHAHWCRPSRTGKRLPNMSRIGSNANKPGGLPAGVHYRKRLGKKNRGRVTAPIKPGIAPSKGCAHFTEKKGMRRWQLILLVSKG